MRQVLVCEVKHIMAATFKPPTSAATAGTACTTWRPHTVEFLSQDAHTETCLTVAAPSALELRHVARLHVSQPAVALLLSALLCLQTSAAASAAARALSLPTRRRPPAALCGAGVYHALACRKYVRSQRRGRHTGSGSRRLCQRLCRRKPWRI